MDKLLNFFCLPLLITGSILMSHGLVGYGTSYNKIIENNNKTSNQMSVYDQELASQPESSAGRILKPERKSQVRFGGKKSDN